MSGAPHLLDVEGRPSTATYLMMSHMAFRRDLARFAAALEKVAEGDSSRVEALREEWSTYHQALAGHHHAEDESVFVEILRDHPVLSELIDGLAADHQRIDPLLEQGDHAFALLPEVREAKRVVAALAELLGPHLAREEEQIIPILREQRDFPPPESDEMAQMYADGFAWSSHGVAEDILAQVYASLPESVSAKIPAARARFAARCTRAWGTARAGSARTAIPEPESW